MKLGTYTTFDCPTEHIEIAFKWLQNKFSKIGGTVRKEMNPHDFGEYPSFEIDYPDNLEFIDVDDENEDELKVQLKETWEDRVSTIENMYSARFSKSL